VSGEPPEFVAALTPLDPSPAAGIVDEMLMLDVVASGVVVEAENSGPEFPGDPVSAEVERLVVSVVPVPESGPEFPATGPVFVTRMLESVVS
jgi:hypothetical protein